MLSTRSLSAFEDFRQRVESLGGIVLEPEWLGARTPHRCRCAVGHECRTRPDNLKSGQGMCRVCGRRDPSTAEMGFRKRVAEFGGIVLEPRWLGNLVPHRCRCAAGHLCNPRPGDTQQGRGICRACAGKDPVIAEQEFYERVSELGGFVIETEWLGCDKTQRVICSAGHECCPRPSGVQQGDGICRLCAGKTWDVFYIVQHSEADVIKFGVTSGVSRPRLREHKRAGFGRVLLDMSLSDAHAVEQLIIRKLKNSGHRAVRGREYFPASSLDEVYNFLAEELSATSLYA